MFKSYEQIRDELLADIMGNTIITDTISGALTYTMVCAIARALRVVWFMLEQMLNLFFVSTSQGSFLERRCNERAVYRKQGTASQGTINLTRTSAAPVGGTLTQGTILATMDNQVQFTINADVTLPVGWTSVTAQVTCSTVGVIGNLAANTPLQIVGAQVVGVQNITVATGGLTGGTDTETDDQLRSRYLYTIQHPPNGGTPSDYVVWATSVSGVKSAIPLPLNRGNGTIDVVITDGGIPSDTLVSSVSNYIQTQRPVGADVQVLKPTAHPINVTGTITANTGYTNANLAPLVTQAIQDYLANIPIGGVVRVTGIIQAALGVQGVLDFVMSNPTANVTLGTTELATTGTLTIS